MTLADPDALRRTIPATLRAADWHAPDGWRHRRFEWTPDGEPRGSILFQLGRGDFMEKGLEAMAHWHARGWHLSGFDWRGQGRSGRVLEGLEINHLGSFDPLLDDLSSFIAAWLVTTPPPHVLIGHSMGGHLMLRTLSERGVSGIDAVVLVAPMIGLATPPGARLLAWLACMFGRSMMPVMGRTAGRAPQAMLTGCDRRHADPPWWRARDPALTLGPPSWGWLTAAFNSVAHHRREGALEKVDVPLLLLRPQRDRLVSSRAIGLAARRLPRAELRTYKAAHELLREADAVRLAVMQDIDAFLDRVAPSA